LPAKIIGVVLQKPSSNVIIFTFFQGTMGGNAEPLFFTIRPDRSSFYRGVCRELSICPVL
jgi:hypothetical protein